MWRRQQAVRQLCGAAPLGHLKSDEFVESKWMSDCWGYLMVVAMCGWTGIMLTKTCMLPTWIRIVKNQTQYSFCWKLFVIFDAYIHIALLPTLLLLPLNSLEEVPLDSVQGMFTINVNWAYWVVAVCLVTIAFGRWITYILPCTAKMPNCLTILSLWTIVTVIFLVCSFVEFGINIGWSAVLLIDLAIVIKFKFTPSLGIGFFASLFQKLFFINFITQNIVWVVHFAVMCCSSEEDDAREQTELDGEQDDGCCSFFGSVKVADDSDGYDKPYSYSNPNGYMDPDRYSYGGYGR